MSEKQQKKEAAIVIGDLNDVELNELAHEFPVLGTKLKPAALLQYVAKYVNKTPGEILDLWRNNPREFKMLAREAYTKDVNTARLINFANLAYKISEGIKARLHAPQDSVQERGLIPYGTKDLEPIKELDPANTDNTVTGDDDLEKALKDLLNL